MSGLNLRTLPNDLVAGLVNGVASVPSSMATAALAGVNPVFGLYAITVAPAVGSLLASSQMMQVATTGASALTASQAIAGYSENQRAEALFLVVALAGVFLAIFGLLKAGRLVRYVSYPVMTAFLSGVALVLVFDQSAQLVGYSPQGQTSIGEFVDLLRNLGQISIQSTLVGLLALAIIVGLSRTRLSNVSSLIGLAIPTAIVAFWRPDDVQIVSDVSTIPRGLPPFGLPDLSLLSANLVFSAFALAVVVAIQGAGISQSYKNPDGSRANPSRDMFAQGAANVAGSLVSGMPTGGSVGQTALNVSAGGKSRLAGIFHSLSMLAIILLVPGLVSLVPMPVLAAVMIVAGVGAIRFADFGAIWRTAGSGRWVLVVTFLASLLVSVAAAVAIGVVAAVVLSLSSAASDVRVRALVQQEDGEIHIVDPPKKLPSRSITVIEVYGILFFAAARTLGDRLPDPAGAERPVVVLRLRGNHQIGSTLIEVLNDYAHELAEAGGRLYLAGMDEQVGERLQRARKFDLDKEVVLVPASHILGGATQEAVSAGAEWLRQFGTDVETRDEVAAWKD
ncbi:SulP family inorganic anion transporter [Deinococcus planocerae]|uniref:SulP family inorganic anion transporter n=1 Tax=Deinococcus planocerae TaxID=1737569 RepID=UPI000C7EA156|nr:SulP family inorganic anion transporter [Deinococcus planocerae]